MQIISIVLYAAFMTLFLCGCIQLLHFIYNNTIGMSELTKPQRAAKSASISILSIAIALIFSVLMPSYVVQVEIQSGDKAILIQPMYHIANQSFYDEVHSEIVKNRNAGYQIIKEGVYGGGDITFDFEFDGTYEEFAWGLVRQPIFLGNDATGDKIADLTQEDINEFFTKEDLKSSVPSFLEAKKEGGDVVLEVQKKTLEETLLGYAMMKMDSLIRLQRDLTLFGGFGVAKNATDDCPLPKSHSLITCERNRLVAKAVNESESDKVMVVYGAAHLWGVVSMIAKSSPEAKIKSINLIKVF